LNNLGTDLVPFGVTFIVSLLLGLTLGFVSGIVANMALYYMFEGRPKLSKREITSSAILNSIVQNTTTPSSYVGNCAASKRIKFMLLRPDRPIGFSGVEHVRDLVCKTAVEFNEEREVLQRLADESAGSSASFDGLVIIVDCQLVADVDYASAKRLGETANALAASSQVSVVFVNTNEVVSCALEGANDNLTLYKVGTDVATWVLSEHSVIFITASNVSKTEKRLWISTVAISDSRALF
jgi:predicted regulator of Ras-like GTPase activity (Roadblock/LC7/MglB family)